MRYLLIILSLTGGLLSFNSYAASCPVGATVPAGTYKPFYQIKHSDGTSEKYINIGGCEYWAKGGAVLTPDGFAGSLGPWVSTGNHVKDGVSPAVDENGHSPEPEAPPSPPVPDVKPPDPDIKPPSPGGGSGGGSQQSYLSAVLSEISSSD
ncbi:TPA: hypothetical protein O7139_005492, partial [Salmonella enterica]|nr:hypothetical protein [Salmonella enterica]HDC2563345.1 hypothetical protein [Salmonella enterica]